MTDSGAYQILVYGGVEYDQKEIVAYEEGIGTDIATILDIPTGWRVNRAQAELTVAETHRRAKDFFNIKSREDILWVGPVQGGKHLDLVVESAKVMGSLPFDIHALGSPTEVMENYRYDVLAEMILATKRGIPIERPLHLFGAGHPSMFAIAVALGCDLFDSAAYALYAREGRYMTENGTWRLSEMDYFPCTCPKCVTETPKSLISKTPKEREIFLAEHNLWACMAELRRIKQAIRDGRLWELTEMRAHNHPALLSALKRIKNHKDFLATFSPSIKSRGFFYLNHEGIARPEIIQYSQRLLTRYTPPSNAQTLLLLPQTRNKPFHKAPEMKKIRQLLHLLGPELADKLHLAVFCAPFGVVPFELDEVYPLSQHETALPLDKETIEYVAQQTAQYIKQMPYKSVTLLNSYKLWNNHIQTAAQNACTEKNIPYNTIETGDISDKQLITNLKEILQKQLLPLLQPTTNTQL
jgi:7-cyano-7-deazaguanine tRNA-ribosyltransferase